MKNTNRIRMGKIAPTIKAIAIRMLEVIGVAVFMLLMLAVEVSRPTLSDEGARVFIESRERLGAPNGEPGTADRYLQALSRYEVGGLEADKIDWVDSLAKEYRALNDFDYKSYLRGSPERIYECVATKGIFLRFRWEDSSELYADYVGNGLVELRTSGGSRMLLRENGAMEGAPRNPIITPSSVLVIGGGFLRSLTIYYAYAIIYGNPLKDSAL